MQDVSDPTLYATPFASPQLELLELDDAQWIRVQQRAWHRRAREWRQVVEQLPLLRLASLAGIVPSVLAAGVGKNFFPYVSTVM